MRCSYLLFLFPFLFISCTSTNGFSKRKYLTGIFHQENHSGIKSKKESIVPENSHPTSALQETIAVEPTSASVYTSLAVEKNQQPLSVVPVPHESLAQPTDTVPSPKTKRELRRERWTSDKARADRSLFLGIYSIAYALIFALLGLWLSNKADPSPDGAFLLLLLLFAILIYFAAGLFSVLASILASILSAKVRIKNRGKTGYEGKKNSGWGVVTALIGLALLVLGVFITLPFNW